MAELNASDVAVVIPTRDRWDILERTLAGLSGQTVSGFETVVVVDGADQRPPRLEADRILVKRRAGPAAARNAGARSTECSLVMFLGDDTIPAPDLVQRHLTAHGRHPQTEAAVVGLVGWHSSVASNKINRWLEWSGTQSWYSSLADDHEQEVSHWYFYTSNLSLKRSFILGSGGFDEDFPYAAFEDLECGLRLSRQGLRLYYEPAAICHHLHDYDWPALERRFATMALSERLMVEKHPELDAGCLDRMKEACSGRVLPMERLVDIVPARWKRLDSVVRRHANRSYHRRLAPVYLEAWDRAEELCELRRYLGERHDSARLVYGSAATPEDPGSRTEPSSEEPDGESLFDLVRHALAGGSEHVVSLLRSHLPPGSRILQYRCGIGSDGLRMAREGYSVQFADHPGLPLSYLEWRLQERELALPVYNIGLDELPRDLDAVVCLDATLDGRTPLELLRELEKVAPTVAMGIAAATPGCSRIVIEPPALGDRSRLIARYELTEGSFLLVYSHDGHPPTTPRQSDARHLNDRLAQGRG